jgi:hypothetical protein
VQSQIDVYDRSTLARVAIKRSGSSVTMVAFRHAERGDVQRLHGSGGREKQSDGIVKVGASVVSETRG